MKLINQGEIKDEINSIQIENYNVQGLCDYLKEFVKAFTNNLDFRERKLLIESLVNNVEIGKNKKVTVTLQPPLHSLGFLSPSLAPREEKPKIDFTIWVEYYLADYYSNIPTTTRIYSRFSPQEYTI